MAEMLSPTDQLNMVSSFLEIAVGQSDDTARQFLQATSWKLEEAIQLYYVGNEGPGSAAAGSSALAPTSALPMPDSWSGEDGDEVRAPLPVIREALYDDALMASRAMRYPTSETSSVIAFRNFNEEVKRPDVWESAQGSPSTAETSSRDNLASLYRPPFNLMFQGSFEKAKYVASDQDKWLVVNLQSTTEFSSHMLNRDTWANEAVSQTISTNFIFWQVYDDTTEGRKVCTYYKLDSIPVVLVIDPITGQKMRSWNGMVQPERLLEDLLQFMDNGPRDHHVTLSHKRPRESPSRQPQKIQDKSSEEEAEMLQALAMSMENQLNSGDEEVKEEASETKKPNYPDLPEEPKADKALVCRVGVRLPDGRRVQRNFLKSHPIQLLWSFCCSVVKEAETRQFRLTQAIPGASKSLDYDSQLTFEESGLANSMISVTWE